MCSPRRRTRSCWRSRRGTDPLGAGGAGWRIRPAAVTLWLLPIPPSPMKRILPRTPLSDDPREFVLAAILFTVAAVLFAGFGVTTLRGGTFVEGDWSGANLAYQVLGWGKWVAGVRLGWLGGQAALHRRYLGWRRAALLWLPFLLFAGYACLQRLVLEGALSAYLERTGHPGAAEHGGMPLYLVLELVGALALAAANALRVRGRGMRLAL